MGLHAQPMFLAALLCTTACAVWHPIAGLVEDKRLALERLQRLEVELEGCRAELAAIRLEQARLLLPAPDQEVGVLQWLLHRVCGPVVCAAPGAVQGVAQCWPVPPSLNS